MKHAIEDYATKKILNKSKTCVCFFCFICFICFLARNPSKGRGVAWGKYYLNRTNYYLVSTNYYLVRTEILPKLYGLLPKSYGVIQG
jgi:hypothetical protein